MADLALFSAGAMKRLRRLEANNRRRARQRGCAAERVDFVGQCIDQDWKCCICDGAMDPELDPTHPDAISVEHDPALGIGGAHVPGKVYAAHRSCNIRKGQTVDTQRAAKTKRQAAKFGDGEKSEKPKRRWGSRGFQNNRGGKFKTPLNGKTVRRDA